MNETLEKVIIEYFSDKEEIVAVYLFGSRARGQEHSTSDIDLGLLLDVAALPHAIKIRDRYMVEISRLVRKDIHLVILNSAGEGLMKQVFSRGKCIVVNNEEKLTLFRTVLFSRIADFSYYKERMQAGLARKLTELSNGG